MPPWSAATQQGNKAARSAWGSMEPLLAISWRNLPDPVGTSLDPLAPSGTFHHDWTLKKIKKKKGYSLLAITLVLKWCRRGDSERSAPCFAVMGWFYKYKLIVMVTTSVLLTYLFDPPESRITLAMFLLQDWAGADSGTTSEESCYCQTRRKI